MKTCQLAKRYPVVMLLLLAGLLLFACSDPESPPVEDDPRYDRSTPDNLLVWLMYSYKEMDLDGYEECLDEDFLFRFPDEIADSLGLPPEAPWWGKTDEITCTLNMFEDPAVQSIGFGCELLEEWVAYQEVRPDTTFTGLFRRLRPVIVVTVATDGSEDPLLSYVVNQSWLDVVVVPDRYTEGLWCVLRIDEVKMPYLRAHPAVIGSAVESATWGGIKSMWAEE